jgi:hypothetical protein
MIFVWSHLTNGDPAYTLVQVSVNDLIMLVLFVPIVQFLVHGASSLTVPFNVLLTSVLVFIVVPLLAGVLLRSFLLHGAILQCRADRGADHAPGLFQRWPSSRPHEVAEGRTLGSRAGGADRRF